MALDKLTAQVLSRNENVERLLRAGGDRVTRLDAMRADLEAGNDVAGLLVKQQQIAKLQEKVNELLEERDKALNAQVDKEIAESDVDPAALTEVVKAEDASIKQGLNYAIGIYGEGFEDLLPAIKPLKGSRSGGASGGGSGKRRLRGFTVSVDGVVATTPDKDKVQRSSFSAAAKVLGLKSVEPLSEAYLAQAGSDPDNYPATLTFSFSDSDGKVREVTATRDKDA